MLRLLLLSFVFALPFPALAAVEEPVAVMPFRSLSASTDLAWLSAGIAETMIADLRRGHIAVVERAQIDHALKELSLQAGSTIDPATAVRLGKLVGAHTIVVGAVQEANGQLRLTARFVAVQSGVVQDAASATGSVERIFALQDELVDQLLHKAPAARPVRHTSPKTVQAYRVYGQSLAAASDDERAALLIRAVALDPSFVYASDDLAALQKRMKEYARNSSLKWADREKALWQRAQDKKLSTDERQRTARELLDSLATARHWHILIEVAPRMAQLKLPDLDDELSFRRFMALSKLRRLDEALQVGEQHLKSFPTGLRYREVETAMHEIVEYRRKLVSRLPEYQADLKEKRDGMMRDGAVRPEKRLEYDFAPCVCTRWNSLTDQLMLDNCSQYLAQHGNDPDPDARAHTISARYFVVVALAALGQFDRARPLAEKLLADTHEWDEELRKLMDDWPAD